MLRFDDRQKAIKALESSMLLLKPNEILLSCDVEIVRDRIKCALFYLYGEERKAQSRRNAREQKRRDNDA